MERNVTTRKEVNSLNLNADPNWNQEVLLFFFGLRIGPYTTVDNTRHAQKSSGDANILDKNGCVHHTALVMTTSIYRTSR